MVFCLYTLECDTYMQIDVETTKYNKFHKEFINKKYKKDVRNTRSSGIAQQFFLAFDWAES